MNLFGSVKAQYKKVCVFFIILHLLMTLEMEDYVNFSGSERSVSIYNGQDRPSGLGFYLNYMDDREKKKELLQHQQSWNSFIVESKIILNFEVSHSIRTSL